MLLETVIAVGHEESKEGLTNMQTVRKNYEGYTKREILKTKEARRAQGLIVNLSESNFKEIVRGNMIQNCPITLNNSLMRTPSPDLI